MFSVFAEHYVFMFQVDVDVQLGTAIALELLDLGVEFHSSEDILRGYIRSTDGLFSVLPSLLLELQDAEDVVCLQ